jgi:micrococcal nuclease
MIRQRRGRLRPIVALVAALTLLLWSFRSTNRPDRTPSTEVLRGRVVAVLDGDTIVVAGVGKVRYLGIDTPELHHPRKPVQRLAAQARRANVRLVAGRMVELHTDRERRDAYGRLLAYVYVSGSMTNGGLLCAGLARTLPIWPNLTFAARFERMLADAQRRQVGLWSTQGGGLPWGSPLAAEPKLARPGPACATR